jgi:hypothetical protein
MLNGAALGIPQAYHGNYTVIIASPLVMRKDGLRAGCALPIRFATTGIVSVPAFGRLDPSHCPSAHGGTSEGRPPRMRLRGQRGATTIGVIQMSPKRSPTA